MSAEKINSSYEPPPPYTTNPPPQGAAYTAPGPYGGNVGKKTILFLINYSVLFNYLLSDVIKKPFIQNKQHYSQIQQKGKRQ